MSRALDRLRSEVDSLPKLATDEGHASEQVWHGHVNEIRRLILEDDPARFLTWSPIASTMATLGHEDWSGISWRFLQALPDWESRWRPVIAEVPVGSPAFYGKSSPLTSNTLMTHAHCLALFEQRMGVKVSDLKFVFEFGGGYGCACRLLYSLEFAGRYIDYDLPVVAALARYYLDEIGLLSGGNISCISDFEVLAHALLSVQGESLFLSTWALSETPLLVRHRILSLLVGRFKYFYLIYQPEFREVDNIQFFDEMMTSTLSGIHWQRWEIEHLGATALAGVRT